MSKTFSISQQEAAQEILRRRSARKNLIPFIEYTHPNYQTANHHRKIAEALEAVERGEIRRLIIEAPPRHGKSEMASRRYPAWSLGQNPRQQIITATYNAEFAQDIGRDVRTIVSDPLYQNVFPGVELRQDSKAANRWHTSAGGIYVSAGVGTALTGRGADKAIIDDPFKDRKEADSESRRKDVWDWYRSVFYTRLMPDAPIIVMNTRWAELDLTGFILQTAGESGEDWAVIKLPALDENDEALWPEWYPAHVLKQIRATIGQREWLSLYQQQPTADDGTFFRREWFWRYSPDDAPPRKYMTADFAVTDKAEADDPDFTEIGVHATEKSEDGNLKLYLAVDGWSGQKSPEGWLKHYFDLQLAHKPAAEFAEVGVIRRAIEGMLKRMRLQRRAFGTMAWMPHIGDKSANARALQAMAQMGLVGIADTEYGEHVLDQLLKFPSGKHDDAVDMAALMARAIYEAHPYVKGVRTKPEKRYDEWGRELRDNPSWRTL